MSRRPRGRVFLISLADLERLGSQAVYDAILGDEEEGKGRVAFLGLDATEEDLQAFCDYLNEGMPGEE